MPTRRPALVLLTVWLLLCAGFALATLSWQRSVIHEDLERESRTLINQLSQRVDQHDAHLTSLSALSQVSDRPELSARSGYWLSPNVSLVLSLPDGTRLETGHMLTAIDVGLQEIQQDRSAELINSVEVSSSSKGGSAERTLLEPPEVRGLLSSRSQPLAVTTHYALDLLDLLPLPLSIAGPIALAFLLALGVIIHQLVRRTRNAELHARLSVNEARISHASRVNSLGEMASGMAHELNQPLTAVLGQSQAGLRLLNRPDVDLQRLAGVLEANVSQARRASAILSRLRDWSSRKTHETTVVSINESIANVVALVDLEAKRRSVVIDVQPDVDNPDIKADAVELEQVVFNLIRNALDSLDMPETLNQGDIQGSDIDPAVGCQGLIHVVTNQRDGEVRIVVNDNGRGISSDIHDRLFEPFATDKPGGMGLGLALCARIVGRYDGRIEIANNDTKGATATVVFPALYQ